MILILFMPNKVLALKLDEYSKAYDKLGRRTEAPLEEKVREVYITTRQLFPDMNIEICSSFIPTRDSEPISRSEIAVIKKGEEDETQVIVCLLQNRIYFYNKEYLNQVVELARTCEQGLGEYFFYVLSDEKNLTLSSYNTLGNLVKDVMKSSSDQKTTRRFLKRNLKRGDFINYYHK